MKKFGLLFLLLLCGCHQTTPITTFPPTPPPPTPKPIMRECIEALPPPLPKTLAAKSITGREDSGELIDVMVLFTPKTRSLSGGEVNIKNIILNAVGATNTAYSNSMVKQRIRLVYCGEINLTETTNANEDLTAFSQSTTTTQLRNQYGADCCSLIEENLGGVCGIGYIMTTVTNAFNPYAMSVVQRNCISQYSFAHELGHNMGCSHDRANASYSLFPYSYGAKTADKLYRDIMSYSPGSRVNLFGGVGVSYNTRPLGDSLNDCARTLDATSKTVANFRLSIDPSQPTPIPQPTTPPPPLPSPTPTITPVPTPTVAPSPSPDPSNIVYPPTSPTHPGQIVLIRWNLPQGGNAVDMYLRKGGVLIKVLAGGTKNDGGQNVIIPATAVPGSDYQIMIKQYSDLKNYYSDYFSIE